MSRRKKSHPTGGREGMFLSKSWRDHSEEEKEAIYPRAQREADTKKWERESQEWVDSAINRHGEELIWISVEGGADTVAKIPAPSPLSIDEAIPELKLVEAGFDVEYLSGTTGRKLKFLGTDALTVADAEAFAAGTRLPIERRAKRSQTVDGAERAKATREKNAPTLPVARKVRSDNATYRRERVLAVALAILANKPRRLGLKPEKPSVHELAGLVAAKYPEHEDLQEGDWKPTQKAASHILAEAREGKLKGKIKPPQNRSRD